jgi:anti-anti-sigma factor
MGGFSVDTRVPGVAFVALTGEHELYEAGKLQDQIDSLIGEGLAIVIDLSDAIFVDSSIVGVLLTAQKHTSSTGLDYKIVLSKSTGEPVRRMFDITGLREVLPIIERDAALPQN